MPIKGEYTWVEKKDQLKISVPLKGVSPSKVDIFVAPGVLKLNYSPYLLEVYLLKEVDPVKHKATVSNGVLNITLFKKEAEMWGRCEISLEDYEKDQMKKELQSRKQEATKQRTELDTKLQEQYSDRKITEERQAVRQQMAIDETERNRMDSLKAEEKKAAEEEVYRTLSQFSSSESAQKSESKEKKQHHISKDGIEDYDMIDDREEVEALSPMKPTHQPPTSILKQSSSALLPSSSQAKKEKKKVSIIEEIDDEDDEEKEEEDQQENLGPEQEEVDELPDHVADGKETTEEEELKYIPPPRQFVDANTGEITDTGNSKFKINFTPRLWPTPQRESKAAEEEDWIAKNRRHLKKHGVFGKIMANNKKGSNSLNNNNTNDISEEDPVWLKAKGDDFFRAGDIKSALNAYSAAIDSYENPESEGFVMDDNLSACFSNRSLCYLRLNLSQDCKLDCDLAIKNALKQIETLNTTVTAEAKSEPASSSSSSFSPQKNKLFVNLIKMLLRRGVVLCQLGQYTESLSDYTTAQVKMQQCSMYSIEQLSKFHITLESIQQDIDRLKLIIAAENAKKKGDSYFAEKQVSLALEKYHEAIASIPIYVSALSNRSACYLMMKDYENALKDCNLALEILQHSSSEEGKGVSISVGQEGADPKNLLFLRTMLHALIPLPNTEKQKNWLMNISLKKAVIYLQLNQLSEAIQIYEAMVQLDPKNEVLKKELEKLYVKAKEENEAEEGQENNQGKGNNFDTVEESTAPELKNNEPNKKGTDLFEID